MKNSHKTGFTLAEILLAMLVFAIAISTILALLARSIETADEILLKDEAINLSGALDSYMSELPFVEAYDIIYQGQVSGDPAASTSFVYAFQYRADIDGTPTNGNLPPYQLQDDSVLGQTYTVVPAIRVEGYAQLQAEDAARTGRLFYVKLAESPANPFANQSSTPGGAARGTGNLPDNPNTGSGTFPDYDSAVLVIFAEFYPVPALEFVPDFSAVEPVFSFNFAVRR